MAGPSRWLDVVAVPDSLAIVFFALLFASLALHALGGARAHSSELEQNGQPAVSVWEYLATEQFWFEYPRSLSAVVGRSDLRQLLFGGVLHHLPRVLIALDERAAQ